MTEVVENNRMQFCMIRVRLMEPDLAQVSIGDYWAFDTLAILCDG